MSYRELSPLEEQRLREPWHRRHAGVLAGAHAALPAATCGALYARGVRGDELAWGVFGTWFCLLVLVGVFLGTRKLLRGEP